MRKTKLQLTGAMLLSCCLLAATPISSHTLITSYAAGSEVSYQLDITPTVTTNVDTYISNRIQDALNTNDVVTVSGNATLTDANSGNSIQVSIPQGKKVIWKATVHNTSYSHSAISLISTATSEFEIANGALLTSERRPVLTSEPNSYVNVTITGGDIYISSNSNDHGLVLTGFGKFDMRGGRIISYSSAQALNIVPTPHGNTTVNIQGGVIFATGANNTANISDPNGNSAIYIPAMGNPPVVNIDADKSSIITWDQAAYYAITPLIRYAGGGYASRHLAVYPGSSTRVFWSAGNGGQAAVNYVKPNGERGMIHDIPTGADDIDFPTLPVNVVYDKTKKGVNNITSPQGEAITFEYTGVNGTNYPTSTTKPVNAGEYEVSTTLPDEYGNLFVSLGVLKINKRAVTIKVANQTIDKDSALPSLPQSFADFTVEGLANGDGNQDALSSVPTFSWNTDGHSVGTFAVGTATAIAYTDNYKAAATAITGVLNVIDTTAPSNPGTNQGNPSTNPSNPGINPSNPSGNPGNFGNLGTATPSNPDRPNKQGAPSNQGTPSNQGAPNNQAGNNNGSSNNYDSGSSRSSGSRSSGGSRGSGGSGGARGTGASKGNKTTAANKSTGGDWIQDVKGWWYKNPDGSYPKNAWLQVSYNNKSDWYYFDEQGYMQTGWKLINGKWYYMYEQTEGTNVKGAMAANTTINGYRVDASGAWVQ